MNREDTSTARNWTPSRIALTAGINVFPSKILMPNLLNLGTYLHSRVILIAVLAGAEFLGILGEFLAVPGAAIFGAVFGHPFVSQPSGVEA